MNKEFDFYDKTNLKSYNLNESMRYQLNTLSNLDVFTLKHSENVASLTCKICQKLGLNKKFIVYCTMCAYLHDIGKIFIPQEILQKNGKLTDEEFEVMKTHTTIGYKMCMDDLKLRPYANGPLYHHEGLDGTGYPNGVVKEDLPYEGQIIRVADEFDAIVSKRQYKSHIDVSETLQIIADKTIPSSIANRPNAKNPNYSPMNPQIVHMLFEVIEEETYTEISNVEKYIKYLSGQIKRLETVSQYLYEYNSTTNPRDKKDYKELIDYNLHEGETIENYNQVLEEYKEALKSRQEHIDKLNDEIKKIHKIEINDWM
ncbi:MAG: HD domain-containing protein [Clostridia bacterium]|nr:HD domain-containing protein [Clostridia bacterium]